MVAHQKLPDLLAKVRQLRKTVESLQEKVARLEGHAEDHPDAG
jgi:hypothetical protein